MTVNIKSYVIQELEAYPRILRQIAVLRYEMEHPVHVSAQEMLDAMTYARGDCTGSAPGHVSDKTFYIAMNYRQKAAVANSEISEEISAKLLELERKKSRIEYYVGMLDSRKANVIRLCFFDGRTIEDAAEELNISAKQRGSSARFLYLNGVSFAVCSPLSHRLYGHSQASPALSGSPHSSADPCSYP